MSEQLPSDSLLWRLLPRTVPVWMYYLGSALGFISGYAIGAHVYGH